DARALLSPAFPPPRAGRPGPGRAAPLTRTAPPMLFVQGSRATLAAPALLATVLHALPLATLHEIAGADHGFRVPRRSGRDEASVRAEVVDVATAWLDNLSD